MRKTLLVLLLLTLSVSALADLSGYYNGVDIEDANGLRTRLYNLIKDHTSVSYKTARKYLFGELYLGQEKNGEYFVKDVYCEKTYTAYEMGSTKDIGPGRIPNNRILNCEHTWPKSRFGGKRGNPKSDPLYDQKVADLHHLFPTESQMNGIRGNHKFAEVDVETQELPCSNTSKYGKVEREGSLSSDQYFEPPRKHKGNVARALFYFAVRYKMHISPQEEEFLRKWHHEDPVDSEEQVRNGRIEEIQGNRNPFIDHPELADLIEDF